MWGFNIALPTALAVGLDYLEGADEELAECRDWRPGARDACAVEDESLEGADDDTTLRYSGLFSASTSAGEIFVRSGGASDPASPPNVGNPRPRR